MKKVWTYLLNKELSSEILDDILSKGQTFVANWKAHEMPLDATFEIYKNRIIIVKVDESKYNASGCSIDKLLALIKSFEQEFNIELLNRLLVAYNNSENIAVVSSSQVKEKLESGEMTADTMIFDLSVSTSEALKDWQRPLKETWLKKYLN
ncbi:MAG: hypothetical protein AB7O73_06640 [Bacteroidia bacterium]